jgi:hypothetical protein
MSDWRSFAMIQYDEMGVAHEYGIAPIESQQRLPGGPRREFDVRYDPETQTYLPVEERPMRNLQGKGFIVVSTDGSLISEELATYDDALDKAAEFLDAPKPGVCIYEALALIRPRRDVVARMTKRGGELETQRSTKSLPIPRDYEGEAKDEVDQIAPSDEAKPKE